MVMSAIFLRRIGTIRYNNNQQFGHRFSLFWQYNGNYCRRQHTTRFYHASSITKLSSTSVTNSKRFRTNNNNNKKNRNTKLLLLGGSITSIGIYCIHYFHNHFGGIEGLYRAITFYSIAIPKYIIYRYHTYIQSPQYVWDELDVETSKQGLEIIQKLRGFYIKCGQTCAANIGNAFPVIWQDTMSVLQDQCPCEDFNTVVLPILKNEIKNFDYIFKYVDPIPIGSASIGQVHRAILNDVNNTPVVIKVCYPHVERLLRGDVRTIRAFCEVAQPVHVPALVEIERHFATEFDYRTEAEHLQAVHDNLTRAGMCDDLCIVPKPYRQYCTKQVLVMEELNGIKLVDALKQDAKKWSTLTGLSEEQLQQQQHEERSSEELQTIFSTLETQRKVHNAYVRLYNSTLGLFAKQKMEYRTKADLPLNHAKLVDDLIYIHGHEVLVDGRFNSDCHPGNILLCRKEDGSPQLGLIDYGQVKSLTKKERHLMCRIIIALDDDNRDEIVRLMKEAGFKSQKMDPDVIYVYAKVSYDQDNKELTEGKHIQMFMEDLYSRDPIISTTESFLMVARTSIFLRGLAHALKQSRSCAKLWRPIAEKVLKEDI